MASIEPYDTQKGRRYMVRYRKPDRRQATKKGFTTKRDAKLWAATVETNKAAGTYIDPTAGRVTINVLGPEWLASMSHVREASRRAYETALRVHVTPTWGGWPVADISTSDVRQWVADLSQRRGARTVRRAHYVLQAILETAAQDRIIPRNPARGIKNLPPLPKKRRVYLTYEQVERLAQCAGKHGTLVKIAAYCGLRWGEIAALEAEHIDLTARRIHVRQTISGKGLELPKNGEERSVAYPAFLHAELVEAVLAADGRVFSQTRPQSTESWWDTARRRAGVGVVFHDLRHACASFAVSSGASVKVVQNMLGHRSAAMTLDVYSDLFDQDLDDIAARMEAARELAIA